MLENKVEDIQLTASTPDSMDGQLTYAWRPFALKDTRDLIRDGVICGPLTRMKERLSKASSVFEIKRLVLWSYDDTGKEISAQLLLVFQAEVGNPHNVRMHLHKRPDFDFSNISEPLIDELKTYFVAEAFWRVSSYFLSDGEHENSESQSELKRFLTALQFQQEALLADFSLIKEAPQAAELWSWSIDRTDFEAFFLPYGDGALVVSGNHAAVESIYFCAYGEALSDSQTFLKAYRNGFADNECRLKPAKKQNKAALSKNMQVAYTELSKYLSGKNQPFTFAVKKAQGSDFQRQVWQVLDSIPYGATNSYLEVARKLAEGDDKKAHRLARAVGSACGANPLCIVTPCHRVIGSDNSLTGFNGGVHFKARLLDMELLGQSIKNQEEEDE